MDIKEVLSKHKRDSVVIFTEDSIILCTKEDSESEPYKGLIKDNESSTIGELLDDMNKTKDLIDWSKGISKLSK